MLPTTSGTGTAILNIPIGEGIAVTPIQMAALYASVANGGTWIQPHVAAASATSRSPLAKRAARLPARAKELRRC